MSIWIFQTTCFNNPDVDEAISKSLIDAGVQIYTGFNLAHWNDGEDSDGQGCGEISSASFTSSNAPLQLECGVCICCFIQRSTH